MPTQATAQNQSPFLALPVRHVRSGQGYYTYELASYGDFVKTVAPQFSHTQTDDVYVWRGARLASWSLVSSLTRILDRLRTKTPGEWPQVVAKKTVEHAVRVLELMRGLKQLRPRHTRLYEKLRDLRPPYTFVSALAQLEAVGLLTDLCELFSLAQHFHVATPFLDWTDVPLVGLYFAFADEDGPDQPENTGYRVVFALNRTHSEELCRPSSTGEKGIWFMTSMAHDNPRIVAQQGHFTYVPAEQPLEHWVVQPGGRAPDRPLLIRFLIRNKKRLDCMRDLAALNIQHRTMFPDLHGVAMRANEVVRREVALKHD